MLTVQFAPSFKSHINPYGIGRFENSIQSNSLFKLYTEVLESMNGSIGNLTPSLEVFLRASIGERSITRTSTNGRYVYRNYDGHTITLDVRGNVVAHEEPETLS